MSKDSDGGFAFHLPPIYIGDHVIPSRGKFNSSKGLLRIFYESKLHGTKLFVLPLKVLEGTFQTPITIVEGDGWGKLYTIFFGMTPEEGADGEEDVLQNVRGRMIESKHGGLTWELEHEGKIFQLSFSFGKLEGEKWDGKVEVKEVNN